MCSLLYLIQLTVSFCQKYCFELCPDKTRLQEFLLKGRKPYDIDNHTNPIKINGQTISFSSIVEHVGIIRSIDEINYSDVGDVKKVTPKVLNVIQPSVAKGGPAQRGHMQGEKIVAQ